jgi:uncharacterized protein
MSWLDSAAALEYIVSMQFEWDQRKNSANIRKHGLDFADAWQTFTKPMLIALDDREDYGEDRWIGIGILESRVVVIVYTEPGEDTIRVISLRKALSHERKRYEQALRDQLGPR